MLVSHYAFVVEEVPRVLGALYRRVVSGDCKGKSLELAGGELCLSCWEWGLIAAQP